MTWVFISFYAVAPPYSVLLSFAFLAGNKAIIAYTGGRATNTFLGLCRSSLSIESMLEVFLLSILAVYAGWRIAGLSGGVLMPLVAIPFLFIGARDEKTTNENCTNAVFCTGIKELLSNPQFHFLMLLGFSFAAAMLFTAYLPLWLEEVGRLQLYYASLGLSLTQLGSVLGCPLWGLLSDCSDYFKQGRIMAIQSGFVVLTVVLFAGPFTILRLYRHGFLALFFWSPRNTVRNHRVGIATGLALAAFAGRLWLCRQYLG